jgi:hypothetical protein
MRSTRRMRFASSFPTVVRISPFRSTVAMLASDCRLLDSGA